MAGNEKNTRIVDPALIGKLGRLDLVARLVVEGFLTGLHKSPYHGFSVEFAEHRQYMPGDEIRYLDWKVFAKSDRYYIKQFEEETNLRAHIVIDTSTSMLFEGDRAKLSKLRYSINLAAALAYLMTQQQDAVGLLLFSDTVNRLVPPRSSQAHLRLLLRELESEARRSAERGKLPKEEARKTRIGHCLEYLADRVQRRGLVVLLTDFWDEKQEDVIRALKHFRHRQHEVVVFLIQDPDEAEFPYQEEGVFVDLESGERLNVLPWEAAKEFRARVDERVDYYRRACGQNKIQFERLLTSTSYDLGLLRYLEKRQRLI